MINEEQRTGHYDHELKIEAQHFNGIMQNFPNHFHDYYVIGFLKSGKRLLTCKNESYIIDAGDLLIFNPLDNHACEQIDEKVLDWRTINISEAVMREVVFQIKGIDYLPTFTTTVVYHSDIVPLLNKLHQMIISSQTDFEKEEIFYFLIERLLNIYTVPKQDKLIAVTEDIENCCNYIKKNYAQAITLDQLSLIANLNKYTIVRYFTKQLGITPYQYLVAIRIGEAKKMLENGIEPIQVALHTGFSDQSHFTNSFKKIIGLTPKQYQAIFD